MHFAGCLRLICIAVAGLRVPLSRFLEGAPYKFLNLLPEVNEERGPSISGLDSLDFFL